MDAYDTIAAALARLFTAPAAPAEDPRVADLETRVAAIEAGLAKIASAIPPAPAAEG